MTDSHDESSSAPAEAPQAPAATALSASPSPTDQNAAPPHGENGAQDAAADGQPAPKKRSRGRRGGRGRKRKPAAPGADAAPSPTQPEEAAAPGAPQNAAPRSEAQAIDAAYGLAPEAGSPVQTQQPGPEAEPALAKKRSRGRRSGKAKAEAEAEPRGAAAQDAAEAADEAAPPQKGAEGKKKPKKMFIGVLPGELVEVVLTEDGAVQEYYVEMLHQAKTKGNIYKGYIHNVDSALQAAFINYGAERNGFLQIDEVHPEYYQGSYPLKKGQRFPLIQKVLRPGQEVLVQVVKEPTGKKGAFVTSYLSLPGRYFVYTLGRDQQGVSRKIEDEKERERLKGCIDQISPPEGVGLIVRTAGIGRAKTELTRDYKYLHRLWGDIRKKAQTEKAPALVYKEMELSVRAARDYLTQEVSEIWVDDPDTAQQIREYVALAFPKSPDMVKVHTDHDRTLWERFGLTRQVEQIYSREVTLPSGGRLVFDHTEALTSVDINSGKIGGEQSFAKMALKTNAEAAQEIARQLRLRDIGGQIVIDFIEMKDNKHLREVEKIMRQALKSDRARTDVSGISPFGLMELVRQRLGSSAISVSTEPCPCCGGTGIRRNLEWQAMQTMKTIHRLLGKPGCPSPLQVHVGQELALYMLNNKRELLTAMGARVDVRVEIVVDPRQP
ncbi:RNAse E [Humidesulfovibrio mexicanus]|uniref:Ribonuclease G n=2 Tax=Humidesulfovibrio mexicanus TaxID=147047 RepID=A0A238ZRW5_9BACT|nr:RNAse E [Humidesulfovibrio mexicanus]